MPLVRADCVCSEKKDTHVETGAVSSSMTRGADERVQAATTWSSAQALEPTRRGQALEHQGRQSVSGVLVVSKGPQGVEDGQRVVADVDLDVPQQREKVGVAAHSIQKRSLAGRKRRRVPLHSVAEKLGRTRPRGDEERRKDVTGQKRVEEPHASSSVAAKPL